MKTGRIFKGPALGKILTSFKDKIQNSEMLKAKKFDCAVSLKKKTVIINRKSHYTLLYSEKRIPDLQTSGR